MEENNVFQLFQQMMTDLMIETPSDPIPFLIDKLAPENKQPQRVIIMGPPKSHRKEHALVLSEHFKYECLSVGDLLEKEVNKKSELGQRIQYCRKANKYVEDEVVIELVTRQIQAFSNQSWIIEGFPRTRAQALSLAKYNFIVDKFLFLEVDDDKTISRIKETFEEDYQEKYNDEVATRKARQNLQEY